MCAFGVSRSINYLTRDEVQTMMMAMKTSSLDEQQEIMDMLLSRIEQRMSTQDLGDSNKAGNSTGHAD